MKKKKTKTKKKKKVQTAIAPLWRRFKHCSASLKGRSKT
jgi:hypothetical protein